MPGVSTGLVETGSQQGGQTARGRTQRRGRRQRSRSVPRPPSATAIVRASHEPKNLDESNSSAMSTASGTLVLLNAITQGVTGNTRTGRQVQLEHLRLNMLFYSNTAIDQDAYRIIVFIDKESRGAAPVVGDLLTNTTVGVSGAVLSSHNFDNVPSRFKILADEMIVNQPTVSISATNAAWNQPYQHRLYHIKLKTVVHYYNTSAGTVADIDSNALFFLIYGVNTSNPGTFVYDARLVFRDM
jgi:hypothetical protein